MGTRTPNMSVYKPAPGEQVYDPAFSAGLDNIDAHDHSGAPNKGVQIGTSGIKDGAITPEKLSDEIISEVTVQTTDATPTEAVSISVPLSKSVTVVGRFVALTDTSSANALGGDFVGTLYRTNSGSVTLLGDPVVNVNHNYSSGDPIVSLVADTVNEAISIRCTGVAATIINWHLAYNVLEEPES